MALTLKTKRVIRIALAHEQLASELISKIAVPAPLSRDLKKALEIMNPDKRAVAELIVRLEAGSGNISSRTEAVMRIAMSSDPEFRNLVSEIEI
mgnify:CR=1 FL=1